MPAALTFSVAFCLPNAVIEVWFVEVFAVKEQDKLTLSQPPVIVMFNVSFTLLHDDKFIATLVEFPINNNTTVVFVLMLVVL